MFVKNWSISSNPILLGRAQFHIIPLEDPFELYRTRIKVELSGRKRDLLDNPKHNVSLNVTKFTDRPERARKQYKNFESLPSRTKFESIS